MNLLLEKRKSDNGYWFTSRLETTPPEFGEWGKSSVAKHKEIAVIATCIKTGKSFKYKSAKKASEILNEMEKVAIDIQDELHTRQISDDEVAEKLFDYINSDMDTDDSVEFEQLLWYDNQIDTSINSGMIENAVAIMGQLLHQLEFIRGFILQEFPEISPVGFKR